MALVVCLKKIMKKIVTLLNEVTQLLKTQQHTKQQEVERVLTAAKPIVEKTKNEIKENALNFNIFSALGVLRKETFQSRFLAYLLNPKEQHCQDAIFLNKFLERLDIPAIDLQNIQITPEYDAGAFGRMDIVITCQENNWIVVIENKIDAGEGEQQLERYSNWLKEQKYKLKKLIFLTPTGHESVTAIKDSYRQFSYLELAEIFEPSLNTITANVVRVVLEQYIINLKTIAGVVMSENKELLELLSKPENIRTVLEVERQSLFMREKIAKSFARHIEKIIYDKIQKSNSKAIWVVNSDFCDKNNPTYFHIWIKMLADPNYSMCALHVLSGSKDYGSLVIFREKSIDANKTQALTEKMKNDGYKKPWDNAIGLKPLRNGEGSIISTDIDDVISCSVDNQSETHPLASQFADELWEMFDKYRADIEALSSFK